MYIHAYMYTNNLINEFFKFTFLLYSSLLGVLSFYTNFSFFSIIYMEYILIYGLFICIWNNLDSKNVLENIWNYIARMRGEQERTVSAFVFIYNCMKLHNQWLAYDFFDYIATFFGLLIWLLIFWVKNLTFFHIWPFC